MGKAVSSSKELLELLERKADEGLVRPIDLELASFFKRIYPDITPTHLAALFMVSRAIGESHSCLDLDHLDFQGLEELSSLFSDRKRLVEELSNFKVSSCSKDLSSGFVFEEGKRVYFMKYYRDETMVAERFLEMSSETSLTPDIKRARALFKRLFPSSQIRPDWQKVACATALLRRLCVITGGPGTGKTRTTAALVALLSGCLGKKGLRIVLCAPTGKAAARLTESVRKSMVELDLSEEAKAGLPQKAVTIHRLLGAGKIPGRFRFHGQNRLPYDVVVVDEASMVDLPLLARLVEAMDEHSRLVLLGDKDQLSSVEAGSVLSDVCWAAASSCRSTQYLEEIFKITGEQIGKAPSCAGKGKHEQKKAVRSSIGDCVVELVHNFRFSQGAGLAEFASAVKNGRVDKAFELLGHSDFSALKLIPATAGLGSALSELVQKYYLPSCHEKRPERCLEDMERFKILCAIKEGPKGIYNINKTVRSILFDMGLRDAVKPLFKGLPIILNRNSHSLGLYNGDTGIVWRLENGKFCGFFPDETGLRSFGLSRLPDFQEAFSITIHKSQGSEYSGCLVILPDTPSPILSRQLLYTAATRARDRLIICARPEILRFCLENPVQRFSGLSSKLLGGSETIC